MDRGQRNARDVVLQWQMDVLKRSCKDGKWLPGVKEHYRAKVGDRQKNIITSVCSVSLY